MADIIIFAPRANPNADRAFWKGPIEIMAELILRDSAFDVDDTTPPEYVAPQNDPA